jgi:chromate transporter
MDPLTFFWLFLKASLLSIGGMGNLPFLHTDLLALKWATEADFVTSIAVGQISPGPAGLWSISLGYLTWGWLGAGLALLALSLPTLLAIGTLTFYDRVERFTPVQNFSRGLGLGIAGLTLAVTLGLGQAAVVDWIGLGIAIVSFGLVLSKRVPIIVILFLAAVAGYIFYHG